MYVSFIVLLHQAGPRRSRRMVRLTWPVLALCLRMCLHSCLYSAMCCIVYYYLVRLLVCLSAVCMSVSMYLWYMFVCVLSVICIKLYGCMYVCMFVYVYLFVLFARLVCCPAGLFVYLWQDSS